MPYLWGITLLMYVFFIALWVAKRFFRQGIAMLAEGRAALSAVAGRVCEKMMHLSTVFFVGSSLSATVKIVIFAVGRMLPGKESFFPL